MTKMKRMDTELTWQHTETDKKMFSCETYFPVYSNHYLEKRFYWQKLNRKISGEKPASNCSLTQSIEFNNSLKKKRFSKSDLKKNLKKNQEIIK